MTAFDKISAGLKEANQHAHCTRRHSEAHVQTVHEGRPDTVFWECLACGHTWIERERTTAFGEVFKTVVQGRP